MKTKIEQMKNDLLKKEAHNQVIIKQLDENDTKLNKLITKLKLGQDALQFVENVSMSRRNNVKSKIENVITEALQIIYGKEYSVQLKYDVKNNRSYCEIEVIKVGEDITVIRDVDGNGGGISDTTSVPLRLLLLVASNKMGGTVILDEAYKHVDGNKIEAVGEFLKTIADKLNLQIIMCTHHEKLKTYADTVHEVVLNGTKSIVTKVKGNNI